jgi:hypothetical protein
MRRVAVWLRKQPVPLECFDQPRFVALPFEQPPAENRVNIVLGHKVVPQVPSRILWTARHRSIFGCFASLKEV